MHENESLKSVRPEKNLEQCWTAHMLDSRTAQGKNLVVITIKK